MPVLALETPDRAAPLRRAGLAVVFAVLGVLAAAAAARAHTPYELKLPRGFPAPDIPADTPLTWARIELGRLLFYDPLPHQPALRRPLPAGRVPG